MKKQKLILTLLAAVLSWGTAVAEDHVMAATKRAGEHTAPSTLSLSLEEAQDYAVKQNRTLRNAELSVQQAYAQRWQTIAAMLPQADLSWGYTDMCGYEMEMNFGPVPTKITMPNYTTTGITASVGLNGQAVVGALLNNIAIDMQKLSLEQSEVSIRSNVKTSYASVLVMQDIVTLLDSSLQNIEALAEMTQRSVDVGAAEQTKADQIVVRVNALKNSINQSKRNILLAQNSLKVLLDIPAETELTLTSSLQDFVSAEAIVSLLGEDFIMANNLNYQLLEQNVRMAKANIHMAAWAYGPTVGVGYQYSKQHYFEEGGFRMTPPHAVNVTVKVPLWSSGKRAAAMVEKKIALEEARNTFEETTNNLGIQNDQLRFNVQNAYETYLNEKDNLAVTQRVFANTTNKYNYGSSSNLELVNASNDVISAQSSYVQAVLSLVQAEVALDQFLNNK